MLCSSYFSFYDEIDEKRCANERCDDTDGEFVLCVDGTGEGVAKEQEKSSKESSFEDALRNTKGIDFCHNMWNNKPHKADRTANANQTSNCKRGGEEA